MDVEAEGVELIANMFINPVSEPVELAELDELDASVLETGLAVELTVDIALDFANGLRSIIPPLLE